MATLVFHDKLLTTSAVSAVVIGFALQDTLGNAFAGLAIQSERPFNVGHWIRVGDFEGRVAEVTWRATKLRTKAGNFVVVPNNIVSKEAITNYSEPAAAVRIEVEVGASYLCSPDEVKAAIGEALANSPRVLKTPPPDMILSAFDSSAINYRVRFWIQDYERDEAARDEVRTEHLLRVRAAWNRNSMADPGAVRARVGRIRPSRTGRRAQPAAGRGGSLCRPRRGDARRTGAGVARENVRQRGSDRSSGRTRRVDVCHRIGRSDGGARAGSTGSCSARARRLLRRDVDVDR